MYNCPEKPCNKEKAETKSGPQANSEVARKPQEPQVPGEGYSQWQASPDAG